MLSLRELERAAAIVDARFAGHRVERIVQPDAATVVLTLYGRDVDTNEGAKRHLLLSCAPALGRASLRSDRPQGPETPPPFARFLRARLPRASLVAARLRGRERQLALRFEARDGVFELLLSLMGNRSNMYVLGDDDAVLAALRPLEQTRRTLSVGAPWVDPPPRDEAEKEGADRFEAVADADFLQAVEAEYAPREEQGEADDLGRRIGQALRKERKQAERRLQRIEAELAEADDASRLQRDGELLKSALGQIQPGDAEVRVHDYETGAEVTIALDPSKSPKQNLEATFKRYQKLVRRLAKAGGQVDRARERVAELDALASAPPEQVAEHPTVLELLKKHGRAAPSKAASAPAKPKLPGPLRNLPQKLVPRRYRSRDGLEIWVGRSDEANDYLTTRLARGNDLFFHLDGAPGSHVILRTEGSTSPPHESVLDACELAVRFSKFKNATRADVHVVPIKQVKKPKGAKKGLVYVTGGKSIHLRREEKRSERILASRIE